MNENMVIYEYDGTFKGILTCIFESFDKKEIPLDIICENEQQSLTIAKKYIETSDEKYNRVYGYIKGKGGVSALSIIKKAFLTCHPRKEYLMLMFVREIHKKGEDALNDMTNVILMQLLDAVKILNHEAQLFKGFIRFSSKDSFLYTQIEPKNNILPLIKNYFSKKYSRECFIIYDKTHNLYLIYKDQKSVIVSAIEYENYLLKNKDVYNITQAI